MSRYRRELGLVAFALVLWASMWGVSSWGSTSQPPPEQYLGHVSSKDLSDGVTSLNITVFDFKHHPRLVPCVYAQNTKSGIGVAITCDWNAS